MWGKLWSLVDASLKAANSFNQWAMHHLKKRWQWRLEANLDPTFPILDFVPALPQTTGWAPPWPQCKWEGSSAMLCKCNGMCKWVADCTLFLHKRENSILKLAPTRNTVQSEERGCQFISGENESGEERCLQSVENWRMVWENKPSLPCQACFNLTTSVF